MNSLDIIKKVSNILKVPNIYNVDLNITTENEDSILSSNENLKLLFDLLKLQIEELQTGVCEYIDSVELEFVSNCCNISNIQNLIRIKSLIKNNEKIPFKIINNKIFTTCSGKIDVVYSRLILPNSILDDIKYCSVISEEIYVYGLLSYYCLHVGLFEEYNNYFQLYSEKIKNIKNLRIFSLKLREWV